MTQERTALPRAVDGAAPGAPADGHHPRSARPLGLREAGGHPVKLYALRAPGRTVSERKDGAIR
ncbi:hypothetical protein MUU72_05445 [Streptomyces sp. RS10V-4]|uniref:hypothetical protein n=1 Tax=Streptomyces rhizoryzae TaxID=2932493 RepID=UPI0020057A6E|nr:hypothetical protein [Streptomyces rhizoryzae]MCK7622556.1 hypothetical protein [Streptomyces rhizoryzae]